MNRTILQGKWRRMRGGLKTEWGRLTDNDRRQLDGKLDQVIGLFQERYGYTRERATKAVTHYLQGRSKRNPRAVTKPTSAWLPMLGIAGLFGLGMAAWLSQRSFWAEREPSEMQAAVTSPEVEYE